MLKITKVKRNSIARELGLEVGDEIVAFNGEPCVDELDYIYYTNEQFFTLTVRDSRGGEEVTLEVEKDEDEDLGVLFEKQQTLRTCHNRCVFCFVDQMPKGMRETLYVKDDDYTMSFTCGNFVTLTNVTDEELSRIIRLQLSPLYISVHTLNPDLRVKLLRNRFAGKIVEQIDVLANHGIAMHCQAVIVPGENDGEELKYTARKLFSYYPTVRDLACVPTGLTKYRENLTPIADIDKQYSEKLLDLVDELNAEFGVNFLLPADEYFVKAERERKPVEFYGNFEQVENGVGLTTQFLDEAYTALNALPEGYELTEEKKSLLVCGVSAKKTIVELVQACNQKIKGLTAEVLAVENEFFGKTVTCTGLLTGIDIQNAVLQYQKEGGCFDELVLAGNTLKEFEEVFLCGMTLDGLKQNLGTERIAVNYGGGKGFVDILASGGKKVREKKRRE